jgi:hypothetical protein
MEKQFFLRDLSSCRCGTCRICDKEGPSCNYEVICDNDNKFYSLSSLDGKDFSVDYALTPTIHISSYSCDGKLFAKDIRDKVSLEMQFLFGKKSNHLMLKDVTLMFNEKLKVKQRKVIVR